MRQPIGIKITKKISFAPGISKCYRLCDRLLPVWLLKLEGEVLAIDLQLIVVDLLARRVIDLGL